MSDVTIDRASLTNVLDISNRMSAADILEMGQISFNKNPNEIAEQLFEVCKNVGFGWVFSRDGIPEAFYGCFENWPGIWSVCGFRTEDFHKVKFTVSKFIKYQIIPILVEQGAKKAVAIVRGKNNAWLQALGAKREAIFKNWGQDGSNYAMLAWNRKDFVK